MYTPYKFMILLFHLNYVTLAMWQKMKYKVNETLIKHIYSTETRDLDIEGYIQPHIHIYTYYINLWQELAKKCY